MEKRCTHTAHDGSWWLYDARGIAVTRVCRRCEELVKRRYRPEIFTNPSYEADEQIEED